MRMGSQSLCEQWVRLLLRKIQTSHAVQFYGGIMETFGSSKSLNICPCLQARHVTCAVISNRDVQQQAIA